MTEKLQRHDFVELDYTGKLTNGTIFDTTNEQIAHLSNLPHQHGSLHSPIVCIGEHQVLPGLDKDLEGKEVGQEYTVVLPPELAFGKRDIKNLRIIPMGTFKEHKVQPQPGLQVDVDGERGIVTSIAGGRVVVNFNNPLAGKEIIYNYTIKRKISDAAEKVKSFVSSMLGVPHDKMSVALHSEKAVVTLPTQLPPQLTDALATKLTELNVVKTVEFVIKESPKN